MEDGHRTHHESPVKVEDPLVDDNDHVIAHLNELPRDHLRLRHCELGFPVPPDRRLTLEFNTVGHVGLPDIIDHHGKKLIDPALIEEQASPVKG